MVLFRGNRDTTSPGGARRTEHGRSGTTLDRSVGARSRSSVVAMARLQTGDVAPPFTLPDHDEQPVSLADFAGRPLVVYFYPADDTPGCTKEACQFNDNLQAFAQAAVSVVGISPDSATKHRAFREKYGLAFPLLTDTDRSVMSAYGAFGEKTMYGKKTIGVIRSTFVIGPDGTIQRAWYNVRADGHAAKVLAEISD